MRSVIDGVGDGGCRVLFELVCPWLDLLHSHTLPTDYVEAEACQTEHGEGPNEVEDTQS
jgi:hypothetical protein